MEALTSLLKSINFSMWQIVTLIVVIIFLKDLKNLIRRISGIKAGNTEIVFYEKTNALNGLNRILGIFEENELDERAQNVINEQINKLLIDSLVTIKNESSSVWLAISDANRSDEIEVSISRNEFDNIHDSLKALRTQSILIYSYLDTSLQTFTSRKTEIDLTIKIMSSVFDELLNKVKIY